MLTHQSIKDHITSEYEAIQNLRQTAKVILQLPPDIKEHTQIWFSQSLKISAKTYSFYLHVLRELRKLGIKTRYTHIDRVGDTIRIAQYFSWEDANIDYDPAVEIDARISVDDPDFVLSKLTGNQTCTWVEREPEPQPVRPKIYNLKCPVA